MIILAYLQHFLLMLLVVLRSGLLLFVSLLLRICSRLLCSQLLLQQILPWILLLLLRFLHLPLVELQHSLPRQLLGLQDLLRFAVDLPRFVHLLGLQLLLELVLVQLELRELLS